MPRLKVTPEASAIIAAGKAAGRSSRAIADQLETELGLVLNQTTISRHLPKLGVEKPTTPAQCAPTAAPKAKQPKHPKRVKVLGEIPALEREAAKLQQLLGLPNIPASDRAKLTSELRGCFRAIRNAEIAQRSQTAQADADTRSVLAKLAKLAETTGPATLVVEGEVEDDENEDEVVGEPQAGLVPLPKAAGA